MLISFCYQSVFLSKQTAPIPQNVVALKKSDCVSKQVCLYIDQCLLCRNLLFILEEEAHHRHCLQVLAKLTSKSYTSGKNVACIESVSVFESLLYIFALMVLL